MVGESHCDKSSSGGALRAAESVVMGVRGCCMMKVSRREAGVSKGTKSLLGDKLDGVLAGVSAGTRFPFRLKRARGSIDLRLLWPPRGTSDVSTA